MGAVVSLLRDRWCHARHGDGHRGRDNSLGTWTRPYHHAAAVNALDRRCAASSALLPLRPRVPSGTAVAAASGSSHVGDANRDAVSDLISDKNSDDNGGDDVSGISFE